MVILKRKSPSVRKVWIEITPEVANTDNTTSPSVRKVWIEIFDYDKFAAALVVTFRKEGVD